MSRRKPSRCRRGPPGIALVVVLGVVALFGVLTALLVLAARTMDVSSRLSVERSRARYAAESRLADSLWVALHGIRQRQNLTGGRVDQDEDPEAAKELFVLEPNGREFVFRQDDELVVKLRVLDANNGLDFSGPHPGGRFMSERLASLADEEQDQVEEEFIAFCDELDDYVDPDDYVRGHGRERDGYSEIGLAGFPRNGPLVFREEAFWIAGAQTVLPQAPGAGESESLDEAIRLIPPDRRTFPSRPSFFSASASSLRSTCGLSDEDLAKVLTAREDYRRDPQPGLQEYLGELYPVIASKFSLNFSDIYTFQLDGEVPALGLRRRIVATIDTRRFAVGGNPPAINYWRRVIY